MSIDFEPTPVVGGHYYSEAIGDSCKVTFLKKASVGIEFEDGTREVLSVEEWNDCNFDGEWWALTRRAADSTEDDDED